MREDATSCAATQKTVCESTSKNSPQSKTAWCASETRRQGKVLWMRRNLTLSGIQHARQPVRRRTMTTSPTSGRRTNWRISLGLLVVVRPLCWQPNGASLRYHPPWLLRRNRFCSASYGRLLASHKEVLSGFTVNSTTVHPARLTSMLLFFLYFLLISFLCWLHDEHSTFSSGSRFGRLWRDHLCTSSLYTLLQQLISIYEESQISLCRCPGDSTTARLLPDDLLSSVFNLNI